MNSDTRFTAWQVQEQGFPRDGSPTDKLKFLVRYAMLAPSGHNIQPWKFTVREDEIYVLADKTRWAKGIDPNQRELHIGIGCALESLLVAAEHFGYGHQATYFPEARREEFIARVKLTPGGQPSPYRDASLFQAITARHTSRSNYNGKPLSKQDFDRLQNCWVEPGLWLHMTSDLEVREKVKELLIRGHVLSMGDPIFRKETAYWIGQGVFAFPRPLAKMMQIAFPYMNVGWAMAPVDTRLVMTAPVWAVICSKVNDREAQVKTGQVFARFCLTATALGIRVHPMSPVVEYPELKAQVTKLLPKPDMIPQHAFRVGYAEPVKSPAPRRQLSEVLA